MDNDKPEMTSETEEKGNSSANEGNSNGQNGQDDCGGANPTDNVPAQMLQLSEPFFVADTLEDDESMIAPTQEETAPFLVPSTPALENKSSRREEMDLNESGITVLEETCADLESKTEQKDSSIENTSCNETDLTQDLDLEPTQPIISSNLIQPVNFNYSNDAEKKKDEEDEDDDEWQLKFSESQTQDILNFDKNDQNDKEQEPVVNSPVKEPVNECDDDDDDDEDLPATMSIGVPPRQEEKECDGSFKILEPSENAEAVENQSDDEVEPSQSCLSEYKGETISASYKMQTSADTVNTEASVEEIPKVDSATELNVENDVKNDADVKLVSDSEKRTIDISDSEPKNDLDTTEVTNNESTLSIEEIPVVSTEDNKVEEKEQLVNHSKEEKTKASEVAKTTEENKDSTQSPLKICEKEVIGIESNGEQMDYDEVERIEESRDKSKMTDETETKSNVIKCNSDDPVTNSDEHNSEKGMEYEIVEPSEEELCKDSQETKENGEHKVEEMEIGETGEFDLVSKVDEDVKKEISLDEDIAAVVSEKDISKKPETNNSESLQEVEPDVSEKGVSDEASRKSDSKFDDVSKKSEPEVTKSTEIPSNSSSDKSADETIQPDTKKIVDETVQADTKKILDEKLGTSPSFAVPAVTSRHFGSVKKQVNQNKIIVHETSPSDKKISVGSCKDSRSLQKFLKSIGIVLDHNQMETILLKKNEGIEFKTVFSLTNDKIFLSEYSIEIEQPRRDSTSTTNSSPLSSKISIPSGEMADISSSVSSGKSNSCIIPISQSMNILSSQEAENSPKTSTQKSQESKGLSEVFASFSKQEVSETEAKVSPIKSATNKKTAARKRGKKQVEASSSDTSATVEPKRKRRKDKTTEPVENKDDEIEEAKDSVVEAKPRKATRRKKGATAVPDLTPAEIRAIVESIPMTTEDESSTQEEEANFGSILPGVKVMARWKDGYYYSGLVQSQEVDGRWAVLFEDGFLRTITLENLIKIAILPKGTSVLVQSPDDYYDPGIVCGHFREGNKVGYEVELDNGVTKRYPRSAVILSGDQAKLIMSSRPPTTPATMTINLDNIVDGKRKRKSVQSPATTPAVKKSPRVTRSKKPDSNLDSTADSSTSEVASVKSHDSEKEELPNKRRKAAKGTPATPATTPNTPAAAVAAATSASTSSNSKVTKVLPSRSKKLFKDYAFLLTNADRKVVPKSADSSMSDYKEDDDIVPFDKDELCKHIATGGGQVLEKFEDVKKCTRKYIYLLANSYLRTMKYIQCIAAGISCIKHHWVQNCLFKSEILNLSSYILPAGFSLVSQNVIEWHGKTDIFKGCRISLVSAPESPFVYMWSPVLLAAKADFVQKWSLPKSVSGCSLIVDVLITNNHCPPDIIQSAKKRKIPIVSSEWIIQCLIMGKKLPYDAHPKFKHDYTDI